MPLPGNRAAVADMFRQASRHQAAGELAAAEALCRRILAEVPTHDPSLHLLGVLALQMGRNDLAVNCISQAIKRQPRTALYHFNLANALIGLGRRAEAETGLRQAIRLDRNFAEAHNNLANLLLASGNLAEAAEHLTKAVRLRPNFAEAWSNLGGILMQHGKYEQAVEKFRSAIRLRPNIPELHHNMGDALVQLGQPEAAEPLFREALRLNPNYPEAWNSLAVLCFRRDRFAESEAACREALRLRPGYHKALNNLGNALYALGRLDDAEQPLRQALHLTPDYAEAHTNLAHTLLALGRYDEAWPEYEWRWKDPIGAAEARNFPCPMWRGGPLEGRKLLLHAEQGLGDTIQLMRYVELLPPDGEVFLEVQPALARLAAGSQNVARVLAKGDPLPGFDLHCPLFSLPLASAGAIPSNVPYILADSAAADRWRQRLNERPGLKIGLVWAGNPKLPTDRRRSVPLEAFAALMDLDGVAFVSLQKGDAAAQAARLNLIDWTSELEDFADTAALVSVLDLVIGVDTAVIHLAGALARPVWLLNRFDADWRWLRDRSDCPWYPTLRQFRQPVPGDWGTVMKEVREALRKWSLF